MIAVSYRPALKGSCASCCDGMVLLAATTADTADTDCTYYFAFALQRDAAGENHDLAIVRHMDAEELGS